MSSRTSVVQRLWGPIVTTRTIPCDPDEVFEVLADPETYPAWLVGAQNIRAVDDRFPEAGAEFEHSVGPSKAATIDDSTESLGATEDRHLALAVHASLFHARVDFVLTPIVGGGTEVCLREQPVGLFAPLTPLLRPSLGARNAESLRRLASQVKVQTPC